MAIVVAVALSILSLAIVLFPLVVARYGQRTTREQEDASPEALEFQSVREAIQTLRLDYDLGKVAPGQYEEQLQAYRLAAADALRRQSQAGQDAGDALLESEVLAARQRLGASGEPAGDFGQAPGEQSMDHESTETSPGR